MTQQHAATKSGRHLSTVVGATPCWLARVAHPFLERNISLSEEEEERRKRDNTQRERRDR